MADRRRSWCCDWLTGQPSALLWLVMKANHSLLLLQLIINLLVHDPPYWFVGWQLFSPIISLLVAITGLASMVSRRIFMYIGGIASQYSCLAQGQILWPYLSAILGMIYCRQFCETCRISWMFWVLFSVSPAVEILLAVLLNNTIVILFCLLHYYIFQLQGAYFNLFFQREL